jgi:hypothetical protein
VSEKLKNINLKITSLALVLASIMATLCSTTASAQNPLLGQYRDPSKISRSIMNAETKRGVEQVGRYGTDNALAQKFALPPLPGDQAFSDSLSEPDKYLEQNGVLPDYGANERKNVNISLPPLKGLAQILNSSVTKQLLKELTASETTVLMQTYMMVENGAATGFMGGMNIGSNLMSNMLQAQDFQLKLLEATDDTGKMKEAYVNKIAKEMQTGKNKDVWPAALYIASGDDGKAANAPQMSDLSAATNPYDLELVSAEGNTKSSKERRALSDMLFVTGKEDFMGPPSLGGSAYSNEKITELRKDFVSLVGDVEIYLDSTKSKFARDVRITYKAPEAETAAGATGKGVRRGVARLNWEEVQVVWQSINTLLYQACRWKESHPNTGKLPFEMETIATTNKIGGDNTGLGNPWELASAPDLTFTVNILDQLLKMHMDLRPAGDYKCDELQLDEKGIPEEGAASSGSQTNLNDCGPGKGCLKNRTVLHLSYMIARSRTLHTYRSLYTIASRFVTEPLAGDLLNRLFNRTFSGMNIDAELEANRGRYYDFVTHMSQLTQGQLGAGPLLRPGESKLVSK